jgi:hypothetical protein
LPRQQSLAAAAAGRSDQRGQAARIVDQVAGDEQEVTCSRVNNLIVRSIFALVHPWAGEMYVEGADCSPPAGTPSDHHHLSLTSIRLSTQRAYASVPIAIPADAKPDEGFLLFVSWLINSNCVTRNPNPRCRVVPAGLRVTPRSYGRTCPSPNTTHLYVVSSASHRAARGFGADGDFAQAESGCRQKRVLALTNTARSTSLTSVEHGCTFQ